MLLRSVLFLLQAAGAPQPPDDRLGREARKAQTRFETVRRAHLPVDRSGGSSSRCTAQIGRYCYWYDSTASDSVPEPRRITESRDELLKLLDSAAAVDAQDAWIAGQRVRYLIEAGRADDAVNAVKGCRSDRWRCATFEGLALHVSERYAEADSVYGVALRLMPEAERCEWLDLRRLVEGRLEREISRASCDEREALANRLWELSQPFWSVPGNDLRTEHFARLTMAAILPRSANAHGMAWGGDSEELLIRYGWAEWFTRQWNDIGGYTREPRVTGHDRDPSYHFVPTIASVRGEQRIADTSWRLRDAMARTRYAPRYLERLVDLPHQLARFPRGDSMRVVVAFDIADTALSNDTVNSWLMTATGERTRKTADRGQSTDRRGRGVLSSIVPREAFIASIEVRGTRSKLAGRARYSVDPLACHGSWCLSDLLLFDPSGPASTNEADTVLPRAIAEPRFSNRTPLGVYWEIQGVAESPQPVWLSLTVSPIRVSFARRLATRLKLASELAPVRLRWQTTLSRTLDAQHVTLRLPHNARGRYRVLLTVEPPYAPALSAQRDIELVL